MTDASWIEGRLATYTDPDGNEHPCIIEEARHETGDHVRVVIDVDGKDALLDTRSDAVEVL